MKKIVVTGSIAYDYLMSYPGKFRDSFIDGQMHNVSLSFLVDSLKRQRGGTAPNIAYTMALLGGNPSVMATVGQDFAEYRQWLEAQGVDTSAIITIEDDYCASFFVNTDQEQNQIASFYTGAMAHAGSLTFAQHAADVDLTIISPNSPEAMSAYAEECRQSNIPFIYDPSQQTARLNGEELQNGLEGCAILSVNDYEFKLIQEKTSLSENQIMDRIGGLLVTKGADGSELIIDGKQYKFPAFPPTKMVEPTGAGDAFRGGLMRGMQLGLSWEISGRMGALAATYVLEQLGTQNHHYTIPEFIARYRQHEDDSGALDTLLGA